MITFIKNLSPFTVTITLLIILVVIMLAPLDALLLHVIEDEFRLRYVGLAIRMSLLFLLGYKAIRVFNIKTVSGLSKQYHWRFKYLNLIPVYLIILGILSVYPINFSAINPFNLLLLLVATLMVGFAEEYLFRGVLQSVYLKKYVQKKNGILISIFFSALAFGSFHLLNLTKDYQTGEILVQVVYAFFIGFFFGALLLKTNKLIPIAITHGLIDFFFLLATLPGLKTEEIEATEEISLAPIFLCLPLFIIGLLIYKKLDKTDVIEKIKSENTQN